jgi:hypothetical protein
MISQGMQKRPLFRQALCFNSTAYGLGACAAVSAAATQEPIPEAPGLRVLLHGFAPFEFFDSTGAILTLIILVSNSLTMVSAQRHSCASEQCSIREMNG